TPNTFFSLIGDTIIEIFINKLSLNNYDLRINARRKYARVQNGIDDAGPRDMAAKLQVSGR
ncbi:MAG: hypothetical protein QG666_822, partial [Euryarchaeota archaeon]|nr:hypothetical protein [Euryarchaeota archaeon]